MFIINTFIDSSIHQMNKRENKTSDRDRIARLTAPCPSHNILLKPTPAPKVVQ